MELRKPGFFVLAVAMAMVLMVSGVPAFAGQTVSNEAVTNGACDLSVVFETRQAITTIGATDWESFEIDGETYLAVANYSNGSTRNIDSRIYQVIKCTKVSGMIYNETWTQEYSPYFLEDDIRVAGLTIEPGVMVRFLGN